MTSDEYRAALKSLRHTQQSWADFTGQSRITVSRNARGEREVPKIEALLISMLIQQRDAAAT